MREAIIIMDNVNPSHVLGAYTSIINSWCPFPRLENWGPPVIISKVTLSSQ
jgi:hypothetical protein